MCINCKLQHIQIVYGKFLFGESKLCVCVYIYIYIYIYIYMYVCIHTLICKFYLYTCSLLDVYTNAYICMHIYILCYLCMCIYIYIYIITS